MTQSCEAIGPQVLVSRGLLEYQQLGLCVPEHGMPQVPTPKMHGDPVPDRCSGFAKTRRSKPVWYPRAVPMSTISVRIHAPENREGPQKRTFSE
jgi:hypothetical protein